MENYIPIMASYTCKFISKLHGDKNMVALCSAIEKFHSLVYVRSLTWLLADFKIRISISSQEKEYKIICIADEKMGAATFNSPWLKIWREARRLLG